MISNTHNNTFINLTSSFSFPISGLISYLSDENEMFMTKDELGIDIIES